MILNNSYLALSLLLLSSSASAIEFQLKPNTWEILVIPGDPAGRSIETLLADDMGSLVYKEDWVMYTYDGQSQTYKSPNSLSDEIEAGQAFWIIHSGTSTVELDIPVGLPEAPATVDATCASTQGCYAIPLPGTSSELDEEPDVSFHLIGSPFSHDVDVSKIRLVTQASAPACASGCDMTQASAAEYTSSFFWAYNSGTGAYEQYSVRDSLSPWQGFWLPTLSTAQAHSPTLNIPLNAPGPRSENMCDVGVTTAERVVIPSIAKPNYLAPYTDPALGARVTRITQSTFGQVHKPVYSTIQAWNADESLLLLYRTGQGKASHVLVDGQNYRPVADLDIYPSDIEDVFWSHSDPDTLFYVSRADADYGEFKRYSVSQGKSTKITDFNGICTGLPMAGSDVHMQSIDDDLFAFRCSRQNGSYAMLSYRISTDATRVAAIGDSTSWNINTAPVPAPSGERFWLQGFALGTDLNTIEQALDLDNESEHSNVGLTYNGQDALFQTVYDASPLGCDGDPDNGIGHLVEHNLETGGCRTFFNESQGYPYTTGSTHVSAQSYNQPGWVAMSSIGRRSQYEYFSNQQRAPALLSEIYLANTDPNDAVTCRLAHHRSYGKEATVGGYDPYFGEPHATISPSGTRILFGSDWYSSGSVDSYVVELPGFTRRP